MSGPDFDELGGGRLQVGLQGGKFGFELGYALVTFGD